MTSGIIEILIEDTDVQTLVGEDSHGQYKVYPMVAPEGVTTPYVLVSEATLNPSLSKGCPSTFDQPRYVVQVYSTDFRETELIQEACRNALDTGEGFTTDAGANFDSVYMVDRGDLFSPAQGQGPGLFVKQGIYEACLRRVIS
jgi:hypothetical protein